MRGMSGCSVTKRSRREHTCLMSCKSTRPISSTSSDAAVTGKEM